MVSEKDHCRWLKAADDRCVLSFGHVKPREAIALDDYFAIHRSLRAILPHYESGEMAIMHGCGSEDDSRSNVEAQDTMEHAGNHGSGWLGRYLRARPGVPSALSAVAIGTTRPESMRGAPSGAVLQSISDFELERDDVELLGQLQTLYARDAGTLGTAGCDTVESVRRLRRLRTEDESLVSGGVMMLLWPAAQRSRLGGTVTAGFPNLSEEHCDELGDIPATLDFRDHLAPVLQPHTPGIDLRRVFPE